MFGTCLLKWHFILRELPSVNAKDVLFQVLNNTPVSPEHNAVKISLENLVLTELTGLHADSESKV